MATTIYTPAMLRGAGTRGVPEIAAGSSFTNTYSMAFDGTDDSISITKTSAYTTTTANEYLSGSNLNIQTVTSTANDNTWETISVSGSFDKNKELQLVFYNQQTGSDSISSFSDLEIT